MTKKSTWEKKESYRGQDMFVPADPELKKWVEIEIEVDICCRCFERGLLKIYEISRTPKFVRSINWIGFEELYNQIRQIVKWMVFEAKYSKKQILDEVCTVYGIHPEYAEIFIKEVMDELGAFEIDGIVVCRE